MKNKTIYLTILLLFLTFNSMHCLSKFRREDESLNQKLFMAVSMGNYSLAKSLINGGANVNARDKYNDTLLMLAIGYHYNLDLIQFLLDEGADVDEINDKGDTALLYASHHGADDYRKAIAMDLLIKNGSRINWKNNKGDTALLKASENEMLNVVNFLIKKGANINQQDNTGTTALMKAISSLKYNVCYPPQIDNSKYIAILIQSLEIKEQIIKSLLENGANINIQNNLGKSALMITFDFNLGYLKDRSKNFLHDGCLYVNKKYENIILNLAKSLLEKGVDLKMKDQEGNDAYYYAVKNKHLKTVELLKSMINSEK